MSDTIVYPSYYHSSYIKDEYVAVLSPTVAVSVYHCDDHYYFQIVPLISLSNNDKLLPIDKDLFVEKYAPCAQRLNDISNFLLNPQP